MRSCQEHDVKPPHITSFLQHVSNLYLYDKNSKSELESIVENFKIKLQNLEIKDLRIEIKALERNESESKKITIHPSAFNDITKKQLILNNTLSEKFNLKHKKKFMKITEDAHHTAFENKNNWFVNISNISIPEQVIDLISLGHKLSVPYQPFSFKKTSLEYIEKVEQFITYNSINDDLADNIRSTLSDVII